MLSKVTLYKTRDGEHFDNYNNACWHEADLDFAEIAKKVKFFDDNADPIRINDFDDFQRKCDYIWYITGTISLLDDFLNSEAPMGEKNYDYWVAWPDYRSNFPDYKDGDVLALDDYREQWVNYSQPLEKIRNIIHKAEG